MSLEQPYLPDFSIRTEALPEGHLTPAASCLFPLKHMQIAKESRQASYLVPSAS